MGISMKREYLTKELGLSKEATEKIMAQYGESVNSLKSENERLLAEIEGLKEIIKDAEETKMRVGELEGINAGLEESVGRLTEELNNVKTNSAVSQKLLAAGAKNLKAVSALIDKNKVKIEDGNVLGLDEQLEAIKSECDYLFYEEAKASGMRHTSSGDFNDGFTSYARAGAKLN